MATPSDILKNLGVDDAQEPIPGSVPPAGSSDGSPSADTTSAPRSGPSAKSAPRSRRTRSAAPEEEEAPQKKRTPTFRNMEARLSEMYTAVGMAVFFAGDHVTANIITTQAPQCADAWVTLAEQNPKVKAVLDKMLQGGAWGGVIFAHGAMIVPILAHHGKLPGQASKVETVEQPTHPYEDFGNGFNGAAAA